MTGSQTFLSGRVVLHPGDCLDVVSGLPDASVDSIVTDPPYALVSIVKRFGSAGAKPTKDGDVYSRASAGFMGKAWDTGERAFAVEFWAQCLRVLKPGGHLAAFSGTRTYHRLAVAIEDAGFEIRDQLGWAYGSGFPKSHAMDKAIDRLAGVSGDTVSSGAPVKRMIPGADQHQNGWAKTDGRTYEPGTYEPGTYEPGTEDAARWRGWGTALKPAWEPICLARKPLAESSVARQVLATGTGAINVDACRVAIDATDRAASERKNAHGQFKSQPRGQGRVFGADHRKQVDWSGELGRWPANILHDARDEVVALFGDAARFFYTAKADATDRAGSAHPTVKPLDLMGWLVRLITPPGGVVLDPFAGTGSTGEAAWREGFSAILIERETEYQADIARRMHLAENPGQRRAVAAARRSVAAPAGDLLAMMGADAAAAGGGDVGSTEHSPIRADNRPHGPQAMIGVGE